MTGAEKREIVDAMACALIDADPTMTGHHESQIEAKRHAATVALAAIEPLTIIPEAPGGENSASGILGGGFFGPRPVMRIR